VFFSKEGVIFRVNEEIVFLRILHKHLPVGERKRVGVARREPHQDFGALDWFILIGHYHYPVMHPKFTVFFE
jgi:hypothetical protein